MDVLYLSHCAINRPDKGEKIRAHFFARALAERFRLHVACFGRTDDEIAETLEWRDRCGSVFAAKHTGKLALAQAALKFAAGGCLHYAYFHSSKLAEHVKRQFPATPPAVTLAFCSFMAQYAPPQAPLVLDLCDVDSEKWLQYGRMRKPGFLYNMEGRRLRRMEKLEAQRAARTLVTTEPEAELLRGLAPRASVRALENGVDFDFYRPGAAAGAPGEGRRYLVFVGVLDYYPNADAVLWFARQVFPEIRRRDAELEFWIVGRNPPAEVRELGRLPGVTVIPSPPDVRPFVEHAVAVVAPLRLARGLQNKVLEGLALGKRIFASGEVCRTFGRDLPEGVLRCEGAEEFVRRIGSEELIDTQPRLAIRQAAEKRFSWQRAGETLCREIEAAGAAPQR